MSNFDDRYLEPPDSPGRCNERNRRCGNRECNRKYTPEENVDPVLWECPDCGTKRGKCKNWPIKGRSDCRLHGGKNRQGNEHHAWVDGKYAKAMQDVDLLALFEQFRNDDQMHNLEEEIALIRARAAMLLGQVDTAKSDAAFQEAQTAYNQLKDAIPTRNPQRVQAALSRLDRAFSDWGDEFAIWGQVFDATERVRRLVDTSHKHMIQSEYLLRVDVQLALIAQIVQIQHDVLAYSLAEWGLDPALANQVMGQVAQEIEDVIDGEVED